MATLEATTTSFPSLVATLEGYGRISRNLWRYVDAATKYSLVAVTNTVSQGVSIAAPVIGANAPISTESGTQEAIQSLSGGVPEISSPSQDMPRSSDSVPQSPTSKQRSSQEHMQPEPTLTQIRLSPLNGIRSSHVAVKILPVNYEFCDVEDLVMLIAGLISELVQINDQLPLRDGGLTRFHSRTAPRISVIDYLQRLTTHTTLTPPLLLSMVYYMDRLCSLYPDFTITSLTVHRFLIAAATVAAKGLSDAFHDHATYARVGGVKVTELGILELEFLYRVDWKIVPNPEVLVDYYHGLVERANGYILEGDAFSGGEREIIETRERL